MRDCETCVYARPYGGENDNRCSAWKCDYINRKEAIEVWLNHKDDGQMMYARGYEAGYNKAVSVAERKIHKALFGE